jgi:hypothetical protein
MVLICGILQVMRLVSVLVLLSAGVLPGQEQPASRATEPSPNRDKALEDGWRNLQRGRSRTAQPFANAMKVGRGQASCAWIRVFPPTPGVDPRIVVPDSQPQRTDWPRPGMPVYEGLPPCDLPTR